MNSNRLLTAFAMLTMLSWNVETGWADGRHHDCYGHSDGHGGCGEMMGRHPQGDEHLHHLLSQQKAIGLTDEQVKKLKAIDLDFDRARIKALANIRIAERELRALVEDDKSDMAAIEGKVKQSEMLEADLRVVGLKARRDALAVLTPEQLDKAKAAHEKKRHDMMGGYGHGVNMGHYATEDGGHPR